MIKVLHIIDTWGPGGAEAVCLSLVSGLDPSRFCSRVIVTGRHWLHDALVAGGVETIVVPIQRPRDDVRLTLAVARQILTWRPQVIQSHLVNAAFFGSVVGRLTGVPVVVTFHGHNDIPTSDRHRALKLRFISMAATRMVFVSDALRSALSAGTGVRAERTAVIHNGVDVECFRPSRSGELRDSLGLDEDASIVGAVGNMRPTKGYDTMLRVMHALRGLQPKVHLAILGWERPPVQDQLRQLRSSLGLDDRVHFLGFRDNVPELMNGMDVYVSTSVSEGFSLTTAQAMACGLPVVCTRSGGPEEIVTDGVDGMLVPVGDVPAIAKALVDLLSSPPARLALGTRGRQTVIERFTVGKMARAYERMYRELVSP